MSQVVIEILYPHRPAEGRRLGLGTYRIGRDGGDIALVDPQVSGVHGELRIDTTGVTYRDLGSTNGSFTLDGKRIERPIELQVGDRVLLGHCTLVLQSADLGPRGPLVRATSPARTILGPSAAQIEAEHAKSAATADEAVALPPPIYPVDPNAAIAPGARTHAPEQGGSKATQILGQSPLGRPQISTSAQPAARPVSPTWSAPLGAAPPRPQTDDPNSRERGYHPRGERAATSRDGTWPGPSDGHAATRTAGQPRPSREPSAQPLPLREPSAQPPAHAVREPVAEARPQPTTIDPDHGNPPPRAANFDSWPDDPGGLPVPSFEQDYAHMPFKQELKARLRDTYLQLKPHARPLIRLVAAIVLPCTLGTLFALFLPVVGGFAAGAISLAQLALLTFITLGVVAQYLLGVLYGEQVTLHEARTTHQAQQGPWAKTMLISGLVSALGAIFLILPALLLSWGVLGAYLIGQRRGVATSQRSLTLFLSAPRKVARALIIGLMPGLAVGLLSALLSIFGPFGVVLRVLLSGAATCALLPFGTLYALRLYREVHDPKA